MGMKGQLEVCECTACKGVVLVSFADMPVWHTAQGGAFKRVVCPYCGRFIRREVEEEDVK